MVPDKYASYIDQDTYEAIQAILRDNYQEYHRRRNRGVARSGAALLQGLVYCGHCGKQDGHSVSCGPWLSLQSSQNPVGGQQLSTVPGGSN